MSNNHYSTKDWKITRAQVVARDDNQCFLCRSKDKLKVHHFWPLIDGGNDNLGNLITLCHRCHLAAHVVLEEAKYPPYEWSET